MAGGALILAVRDEGEDECPVCLEGLGAGVVRLPCGHRIHTLCLKSLLDHADTPSACPLCRADLGCAAAPAPAPAPPPPPDHVRDPRVKRVVFTLLAAALLSGALYRLSAGW